MVVPEAMAVGVPAIVSDRVGAKSIIEEHPEAGWIVPFGAEGLRSRIIALARDQGPLEGASRAAEAAAKAYSWAAYRTRVAGLIDDIWQAHAAARSTHPVSARPHQDNALVASSNRLSTH
jgi:glycosyltransferase involved in cell wall biosynthesis